MYEKETNKIVVFDMDETLGYFLEFSMFWESLKMYCKYDKIDFTIVENNFNNILNLYPEFIRPNILSILKYLKHQVELNKCHGVMIYTNNNGPKEWIYRIKDFFDDKIKYKLFNHVICAFKVNGRQVEMCRTTYEKTLTDLIKCSKLPINTQFCFLDDIYHPKMNFDNVYYIKLKPYIHDLSFDEIINRFTKSDFGKSFIKDLSSFNDFMKNHMNKYEYKYTAKSNEEYEIDRIITKKTMIYLQNFFHNKINKKNNIIKDEIKFVHHSKTKNKKKLLSLSNKNKTMKNR